MSEEDEDHPKGILKNRDKNERKNKTFQWDEMNILATYHPADKDYGHMKVDEPPTPYNFDYGSSDQGNHTVSPDDLASRLAAASAVPPKMVDDHKHDADAQLTPEEAEHRRQFEQKRKKHYNEYQAVLAMRSANDSNEGSDDEDDDDGNYVDPVAARNAMLNSQLSSTSHTPDLQPEKKQPPKSSK